MAIGGRNHPLAVCRNLRTAARRSSWLAAITLRCPTHSFRFRKATRGITTLNGHADRLGPPQTTDGPEHPRRVPANNLGYFKAHRRHMDYPACQADAAYYDKS